MSSKKYPLLSFRYLSITYHNAGAFRKLFIWCIGGDDIEHQWYQIN
jgi:hypothetical protein